LQVYDDLIMDHIKNARNYRAIDAVESPEVGSNPLCGDEMLIYLEVDGERISDIAFQCSCCGISMASASMMTEMVKGSRVDEARRTVRDLLALLREQADPQGPHADAQLALLDTVRKFPARLQCATLAWSTLERALAADERAR
jgi:nitrogen fixation NifU-like protein